MDNLWPVYEFRPIVERPGNLYRYANGQWIPYDGEWDVAFYGDSMAYYVDLPYRGNILWSWVTRHWSDRERLHRGGNPWHYMLRTGETEWGGDWGRSRHKNTQYGDEAMCTCSMRYGCANGRGPRFELNDEYMKQGLVRVRDTKELVIPPQEPECMYCGYDWLVDQKRREKEEAVQESRF